MNAKSTARSKRDTRGYHHGDLPEALMDAAIEQIAQEGTEKLSLRALARECGVSATAPYRHFPSKRCLLAAIATRGFRELQRQCESARSAADSLEEQLIACSHAYIQFALDNPTAYHLMFGSVLEDFSEYQSLSEAAEVAYAVLLELLEELIASEPDLDMAATELGGVIWSAIHGIASLLLYHLSREGQDGPGSPLASLKSLRADPDGAVRLLLRGLFLQSRSPV